MKDHILVVLSIILSCAAMDTLAQAPQHRIGPALDEAATAALVTALTGEFGEYAARARYQAVINALGQVEPFTRIIMAEDQHIAALQQQCAKFGIKVPDDTYFGNVEAPDTLLAAAQEGVLAETMNVAMYSDLLPAVQNHPSLVNVFETLQAASLDNHLEAFEKVVAREE